MMNKEIVENDVLKLNKKPYFQHRPWQSEKPSMSIARVRSITFNTTRMADAFEADFSEVGRNFLPKLEHVYSI